MAGNPNCQPFLFWSRAFRSKRSQLALNQDILVRGLRKMLREPKRVRRRPMLLVVLKAFASFRNCGNVARRNPPQTIDRLVHFFEPLGAVAQDASVIGFV